MKIPTSKIMYEQQGREFSASLGTHNRAVWYSRPATTCTGVKFQENAAASTMQKLCGIKIFKTGVLQQKKTGYEGWNR